MDWAAAIPTKLRQFIKAHPLLTIVAATAVAIILFIGVSIYADSQLYDYQTTADHQASGLADHVSVTRTLVRYDGQQFLQITRNGYAQPTSAAFLPLYPLLARGLHAVIGGSYEWSLLLVAWGALLGASVVLYKWMEFELKLRESELSPWLAIGLLAVFPTAIYYALPYTESIFLLVNLGSLLAFRRERYILAAMLAAAAAATRYQGLVLPVFFVATFVIERKPHYDYKKLIPIIGTMIGFAAYMIFLQRHYGNSLQFLTAEKSWGRLDGGVLHNLLISLRPDYLWYFPILGLGLWAIWKQLGIAYFVYGIIFILQPLSSGSLSSINRYMVSLTPMFLALALFLYSKRGSWLRAPYVASSAFLMAWSLLLFVNGYWVA